MPTWSGWQREFLTAAQILITPADIQFLTDWAAHAETNCDNNPIDLSVSVARSTDCHSLPAINAKAQRYTTHGNAAHAFYVETHRASSTALLAALKSGDPYTVHNTGVVAQELTAWGSQTFAHWYFNQTASAPGRGGGGGGPAGTHATKAWGDLQQQINHGLPTALRKINGLNRATANALGRRSRVRR